MFQYATILSVAKRNGFTHGIPENHQLMRFKGLTSHVISSEQVIKHELVEKNFSFDPNVFSASQNTDLVGFFQSEKYFSPYKEQLKLEFAFPDSVRKTAEELITESASCAVHVRGGDYLQYAEFHAMCSVAYYRDALNIMRADGITHFYVFTDDISFAKTRIPCGPDISFVSNGALEDLCSMTVCENHIIANLSFSWWGAYLSESRLTIAPRTWFGPKGPVHWQDVYCDEWKVI